MRARRKDEKLARRRAIMEAATCQIAQRGTVCVTMADVAAGCGLAKGTVYLYFTSKEELCLAVLEEQLLGWFDALEAALVERDTVGARRFSAIVVATLAERGAFHELLPRMQMLLQASSPSQTEAAFRSSIHDRMRSLESLLEATLRLAPGEGARVLVRTLALVIGRRDIAVAQLGIDGAIDDPTRARERIDGELGECLAAIVEGMRHRKHSPQPRPALASERGTAELEPKRATTA
jgi:AcrR family transcriptional regulator